MPPSRSDPVKSPKSSLNRSSPFSPFSHYHRHRRSPSRRSSILIQTHCRCQSSIPRASRFCPSTPRGGRRPSAPRRAMCGALKTRQGCLRATTSRRGRSGRLLAHVGRHRRTADAANVVAVSGQGQRLVLVVAATHPGRQRWRWLMCRRTHGSQL